VTESESRPRALLIHRGELADVRIQLQELEVAVEERESAADADLEAGWDLVVFRPPPVPEIKPPADAPAPVRIAVVREHARTLRALLRRDGVDLVVRRPFHPEVLRLLLLRAVYRGPERRRRDRVAIGSPVSLRTGLRRHSAVLADLSRDGCRVICERPLQPGRRVSVVLSGGLTGAGTLRLRGRVDRVARSGGENGTAWEAVVRFASLRPSSVDALSSVMDRHAGGPAALSNPGPMRVEDDGPERRRAPRHLFSRRVIALGDAAARVLIGRDLSAGGMRVESGAPLRVGERVRLALHAGGDEAPLVVSAVVVRNDGESGFVLRFTQMNEAARGYLARTLSCLPGLDDLRDSQPGSQAVVSELLDPPAH
jgi:hypothetical protein